MNRPHPLLTLTPYVLAFALAACWAVFQMPVLLPHELLVPALYPIGFTAGMPLLAGGLTYASYLDYRRDPDLQPVDLHPHA